MKKLLLLLVLLLCVFLLTQGTTLACQCYLPDDPATEYEQVDAVFMGVVLSVSPTSLPFLFDYVIGVTGYWKGTIVPFMHVYTGIGDGDCGTPFPLYEEFLFYTLDSQFECCPGAYTDCYRRTRSISRAGADLDYLGDPQTIPVEQITWGAVKEIYRE